MKLSKLIPTVSLILLSCLWLSSCSKKEISNTSSAVKMGTAVSVKTYSADEKNAVVLRDGVLDEIGKLDMLISKNQENAEVYKINQNSGNKNSINSELYTYINKTKEVFSESGGRLSVSSGALTEAWGVDTDNFRVPTDDEINALIPMCDDGKVVLTENSIQTAVGQKLNLGAVGKGIACDKAVEYLKNHADSINGAVISVGGSIGCFGTHDGKDTWTVGIRDPYGDENSYFAKLTVKGISFTSTSGSYEKKFTFDGKNYHHILDLKTGYPVENDLISVTVTANSGLESDALSTLCFVLGEKNSKDILLKYNAYAIFVYKDKSVSLSDGLKDSFEITNKEYTLI